MPSTHLTGWWGTVLDCPDATALAEFYARLLGWRIVKSEPTWATISSGEGTTYVAFQTSPGYERPTWPSEEGSQQMMAHLDIGVSDLEAAVAHASDEGATQAEHQPNDDVRVMLDPAGHPFCLYLDKDA